MAKKRKLLGEEISEENLEIVTRLASFLGEADQLLDKIADSKDDSYTILLNLIHTRIPDSFMLEQLLRDARDSEMRCPK